MCSWRLVWLRAGKSLLLFVAVVIGVFGINQVGWSGLELILNGMLMGPLERLITGLFLSMGTLVSYTALALIHRTARPLLWVVTPIFLYSALVLGAGDGLASDFDATRLQALKHHGANAYALEHMSERGRYLSCQDDRISLTDDGKAACARALNVAPGERIPGSEFRCGLLGLVECFKVAPKNETRAPAIIAPSQTAE